ncbi:MULTISPECIES: ABC transporter ATP-binding protein [Nocardioides]|uniref:ABC transporter ATP-binding protein n=1 Tax=Nocardioides vastitatis TaxID=2568655 RepID=A0ABW0ZBZ8_9ACTN|nr:ABC transporter ATP-binding protein [Nocardioides sp.]THI91373.1 ABC transporter ATP-binding protein [Nocardioides sp.]
MSPTFRGVVRQGRGWVPLIGVAALLGSLATLALPTVLGRAVDSIVAGGASDHWFVAACVLIAVGVLSGLVDSYADAACAAGGTAWLRRRLVGQVLAAGPHGTRGLDTGDLVSRVSGSAVDAGQAAPVSVTAVATVLPPAGSLVLLAVIDPWLAAAFLVGVVGVLVVLAAFSRRTTEISQAYAVTQGRIAALLTESLTGIRTIAAAGTVQRERDRILQPLPELHRQGVRTWQALARSGAQAAVIGPLVLVSVLAAGGLLLSEGRITAGELFAAGQYAILGAGLGSLTGVLGELARARAGSRRADEIAGLEPLRYGALDPEPGPGRLDLVGVTVDGDDGPLLADVNLSLPGGTTVAVVGSSGAGKSVLAALVARLRDPDRGRVLLDGVPLPELSHHALRTAVGVAFERPALFGTTVAAAIGAGTTDPDRVVEAARATHAHDFVSRLPAGYDTPLNEAPLSGGEAQRLGLARAWHADRLLLLDDATSSLDTATEVQISSTLTARGDRSRLIVTHRAGTADRADLVVWLHSGRVRSVGMHRDLWLEEDYRRVFG